MAQVTLTGWRPGLNKVGMTKALQAELGLSLGQAKTATDDVLAGRPVALTTPDDLAARRLAGFLDQLGVEVHVTSEPIARQVAG